MIITLSARKAWFKIILLMQVTIYPLLGPSISPLPGASYTQQGFHSRWPICWETVARGKHMEGLSTVVYSQNWSLVVAVSLPFLAFGRKWEGKHRIANATSKIAPAGHDGEYPYPWSQNSWRLMQKDQEFKANLGYIWSLRPVLAKYGV